MPKEKCVHQKKGIIKHTKHHTFFLILILPMLFFACRDTTDQADAYGNFESVSVIVSPEASGKLLSFSINEGKVIATDELVGLVDTIPLHLKKKLVSASVRALKNQLQNPEPQMDIYKKQLSVLEKERSRIQSLVSVQAATQKQLDDITGQAEILAQQMVSLKKQTATANQAILSQIFPLESQIIQLNDQISRCFVRNPVRGTVLLKLAEPGENVSPAKPLYTIANLDTMVLRAYVSGGQLSQIKPGQLVNVQVDEDNKTNAVLTGEISWISSQAEFTPRTIQTKEERVNQVYAFKVRVANPDGRIKIGMPGEVHLK